MRRENNIESVCYVPENFQSIRSIATAKIKAAASSAPPRRAIALQMSVCSGYVCNYEAKCVKITTLSSLPVQARQTYRNNLVRKSPDKHPNMNGLHLNPKSPLEVQVHPVVLFSVIDHHLRRSDDQDRVIGVYCWCLKASCRCCQIEPANSACCPKHLRKTPYVRHFT